MRLVNLNPQLADKTHPHPMGLNDHHQLHPQAPCNATQRGFAVSITLMTSVLSKIKNLGEHDFSAEISNSSFKLDDAARFGINGNVSSMTFDPVQSLLAIGTDNGSVYVMGQQNVSVEFALPSQDTVEFVRIVRGVYLAAIDTRGNLSIIDMEVKEIIYNHRSYSKVTAVESDPALDWLFLGHENGLVTVFDVDRGILAPFRIGSLQRSVNSRARATSVLGLSLHPRDPSTLMVAFSDYVVIFSLARSEIIFSLQYKVPAGAPGGDNDPLSMNRERFPAVVTAKWHPNGHHIVTAHQDGSLVFWDANEGTLLQARTTIDTEVNIPRRQPPVTAKPDKREAITGLVWCCTQNPEETSLLISGGELQSGPIKGMTWLDYGSTPQVAVTSYAAMGKFYAQPKHHKMYPLPESVDVVEFIMINNDGMPFYGGNFNPSYCLSLLSSGELLMMKYPEGYIVTDPTILPASLGWINPYVTCLSVSLVPRTQWIGMMASAHSRANTLFKGGAPTKSHLRTFQARCALLTGHSDGTVKVWDASHGEVEDANVLEMNMSCALLRHQNISVTHVSMAGIVAESAIAVTNGDVVLFSFGMNTHRGLHSAMKRLNMGDRPHVEDIKDRAPHDLKEGFLPKTLINSKNGPATALCNSNIGFVAVGYSDGTLAVLDRRGPAIILDKNIDDFGQTAGKSKYFSKRSSANLSTQDYVTALEFSIHALNDEEYSSIVLTAGTSQGQVLTFKILPTGNGGYAVQFVAAFAAVVGSVLTLAPFNLETGISAVADPETMSKLGQGILIHGAMIVVSSGDARVIRLPNTKLSHKKLGFTCLSAGYTSMRESGGDNVALVCVAADSTLRIMALPSLREIKTQRIPYDLSPGFGKDSVVTPIGDVILRPSKAFGALVKPCGRGLQFGDLPKDDLYDAMKTNPPRPVISTLQWVKGRQFTTIEDLDLLIGGPRRPRGRRQTDQEKYYDDQQRRQPRPAKSSSSSSSGAYGNQGYRNTGAGEGGYWEGVQDTFNNLGQSANEMFNGMSEMVDDAGKNAQKATFTGMFKSKFF